MFVAFKMLRAIARRRLTYIAISKFGVVLTLFRYTANSAAMPRLIFCCVVAHLPGHFPSAVFGLTDNISAEKH